MGSNCGYHVLVTNLYRLPLLLNYFDSSAINDIKASNMYSLLSMHVYLPLCWEEKLTVKVSTHVEVIRALIIISLTSKICS